MRTNAKIKPSSSTNKNNNKKSTSGGQKAVDQFLMTTAEVRMVLGRNDVPATLVAVLLGYTNGAKAPAFDTMKTQLVKTNLLQITNKGCIRFTTKGLEAVPSSIVRPTDNKQTQELLRRMLHTSIATMDDTTTSSNNNNQNQNNINLIFDRLLDGHVHTRDELVGQMSSKKKKNSSTPMSGASFGMIVRALKDLNLIAKGRTQELQMTDTAFPFGRP